MTIKSWLLLFLLSSLSVFSKRLRSKEATYQEAYRPLFHFTPPSGWLGEPTGIVFDGKLYHLFAKYTPNSLVPGASHWYHATSNNLVDWTDNGIVLSPRGKYDIKHFFNEWVGEATDGSAVIDVAGSCGCGKQAIVLYWTDREPDESSPTGSIERQRVGCLFADDGYDKISAMSGLLPNLSDLNSDPEKNFTLYRPYSIFLLDNDAVNNPPYYSDENGTTIADFESDIRAPKIFNSGHEWIMALANCDRVVIYMSDFLAGPFTFGSTWGARDGDTIADPWRYHTPICDHTREGTWGKMGASWEFPDLLPLLGETSSIWWLLFISAASPKNVSEAMKAGPNGGSGTQYFMGQFDGDRFLPYGDQGIGITHWVDYGFDFYAARTIAHPNFGIEDVLNDDAILIAWMNNELYSQSLPTNPWRGAMTLPRRLTVKYIGYIPHLSQEFMGLETLRGHIYSDEKTLSNGVEARIVPKEGSFTTMEVNVTWRNIDHKSSAIKLIGTFASKNGDQTLRFGLHTSSNGTLYYFVERMPAGFDANFDAMTTAIAPRRALPLDNITLQVVLDRSSIEILADRGTISMTLLHFPKEPWAECNFTGDDVQWSWTLLTHQTPSPFPHHADKSFVTIAQMSTLLALTFILLSI